MPDLENLETDKRWRSIGGTTQDEFFSYIDPILSIEQMRAWAAGNLGSLTVEAWKVTGDSVEGIDKLEVRLCPPPKWGKHTQAPRIGGFVLDNGDDSPSCA